MKFTVDEFVISLGFEETVMKGLQKVEKQVLPMAKRIEKSLNKAFQIDASKQTQPGINKMVKSVERAGKQINRALTQAFRVNNAGSEAARQFETNNRAAMRRIRQEMRSLYAGLVPPSYSRPGRGGNGGSGGSAPRVTAQQRINDLAQRQTQSAAFSNMQLRQPERAAQYSARISELRDQHAATGDFSAFRAQVRAVNYEYAHQTRAMALQAREAQAAARAQAAAASAAEGGLSGLTGAAGALVLGFMSAQKAIEYFQESVKVFAERTQSKTMLATAFSGSNNAEITAAVNAVADKFGLNKSEAQAQAAQLRMTLPEKALTDADIPKLLETESVFFHQTGMNAQQRNGINYLFAQEGAADKGGLGNNWRQLTENMPAVLKPLMELTGQKNLGDLRKFAHTVTGAEWTKLIIQAMENLNNSSKAAEGAMKNVTAAQGRYANALQDNQNAFFAGADKGYQNLLKALGMNLKDSSGAANTLGKMLGWVFNRVAAIAYKWDEIASNVSGGIGLIGLKFKAFYNTLDADTRTELESLGKTFKTGLEHLVEITMAAFGLKMVGGALNLAGGVASRAGLAGAASAAGIGVRILSFANGLVLPVALGALFGNKIDDNKAKAKAAGMSLSDWTIKQRENQKPLFDYDQWDWVKSLKGHTKNFLGSPGLATLATPNLTGMSVPGASAMPAQRIDVHTHVHFDGELGGKIDTSDLNKILMKPLDVKDLINDHHETVVVSSTGLGGGWQSQGQSAGWNPAFLTR